ISCLEGKLQRHLNLPRIARRCELAARPARGRSYWAVRVGRRNACADAEPLRMVEDVEELGAVLQLDPLSELEILEQREIEVGESGAAQKVATRIAEFAVFRASEDERVEPLTVGEILDDDLATQVIGARAAAERAGIAVGGDRKRQAAPEA